MCEGEECTATAASEAGAPTVEAMGGMAGEGSGGSASVAPQCERDETCQNDSRCDGIELCVQGRCERGEAVECAHGTECAEAEGASCIYAEPSPWLVVVASDKVTGLPMKQLVAGDVKLATFAEREVVGDVTGFDKFFWSPNGKVALLHTIEVQFGSSYKLLRFGAGVPAPAADIVDLPNWADYWYDPVFSADSRLVAIPDIHSSGYLVDLSTEPAVAQIFTGEPLDSGETPIDAYCADPSFWLQRDAESVHYVATLVDGEPSVRALGAGDVEQSSDGRLLIRQIDSDSDQEEQAPGDGIWLESCSGQTWSVPLEGAISAEFSPDSKRLLLKLASGGLRVLSLDDPEQPRAIWTNPHAELGHGPSFTPDSQTVLVELPDTNGSEVLNAVDLSQPDEPTVTALNLPEYAQVDLAGDRSLLVWSNTFAGERRDLLWQSLRPAQAAPEVVFRDPTQENSSIRRSPFTPGTALIVRKVGQQTRLISLKFDAELSQLEELVRFPGTIGDLLPWREQPGMVFSTQAAFSDRKLWWLPLDADGHAGALRLLGDRVMSFSLQPWP